MTVANKAVSMKNFIVFLVLVPVMILGLSFMSNAKTMNNDQPLNARQQSIVAIAAFTANGDMDDLSTALNQGLDAQLTVNEIKEVLVQLYAYAGFPRSLNALSSFMKVLEEPKKKGINHETVKTAT